MLKKIIEFLKLIWKDPLFTNYWVDDWYSPRQNNNQLSVRISSHHASTGYDHFSRMFIEDMYLGSAPFMFPNNNREKYPARIEPDSREKERLVSDAISERNHHPLGDALCDFIRTSAHILFSEGVVFYEIVYKQDSEGKIEELSFELISPSYLFHLGKNYYQIIPWWEAKASRSRAQIIKIPAEKILRIDFPKKFGNKRKIRNLLKRLSQLSKDSVAPDFQMQNIAKQVNIGFDMTEYDRAQYLEIAEITRNFGWDQRRGSKNYTTEYYWWLRVLRRKELMATIRKEVINKLNDALNRSILNLGVQVSIDNLFSVEDVKAQEIKLNEGGVGFIDIFNELDD